MPGGENHSSTGTLDPVEPLHLEWESEGSPVSIHMSSVVAEGISGDATEGADAEAGGLLLGRVEPGVPPAVWIEQYQRITCSHTSGAEFVLDGPETAALEAAAGSILSAGQYAVVGLYRSHTGAEFSLRDADFALIRRYFGDPSDLILLVKGAGDGKVAGQFFVWDEHTGARASGGEITLRQPGGVAPVAPAEPQAERPRRLVPDFVPTPVQSSASVFGLFAPPRERPMDSTTEQVNPGRLKKWLPLLAALGVVGGVLWFFTQQAWHTPVNPSAPPTAEVTRPIGLYVDTQAGTTWRVSWNPNATALHNARNVRLFVRERSEQSSDDLAAGDQNPVDLSARDLTAGSYQYRPLGNDVTFRLEVSELSGRVSAESFRIVRPQAAAPARAPKPEPAPDTARIVQPRATYKAPAVVAAGVRARIKGVVPIDVRVEIDIHGRVTSAAPVTKAHSGIDTYLVSRAVQAAKQWRFEPARQSGRAVEGSQILHFVFEK